jgi:hypothetical protein
VVVLGGFGQGAAAAGTAQVGATDRAGQARGDLIGGAQARAEVVSEGEQGAPVLGGVEFAAGEAVLGAQARRCRRRVDDRGVPALGALIEGAAGTGAEEELQCVLGDVGDVAEGVQAVLGERRGRFRSHAGQFSRRTGPQERCDRLGGVVDDGAQAMAASIR